MCKWTGNVIKSFFFFYSIPLICFPHAYIIKHNISATPTSINVDSEWVFCHKILKLKLEEQVCLISYGNCSHLVVSMRCEARFKMWYYNDLNHRKKKKWSGNNWESLSFFTEKFYRARNEIWTRTSCTKQNHSCRDFLYECWPMKWELSKTYNKIVALCL